MVEIGVNVYRYGDSHIVECSISAENDSSEAASHFIDHRREVSHGILDSLRRRSIEDKMREAVCQVKKDCLRYMRIKEVRRRDTEYLKDVAQKADCGHKTV